MHLLVRTSLLAGALSVAGCLSGGGGSVAPATFIPLGWLPGYTQTQAVAVSADGSVVAGTASTPSGNRQAFRWTVQQGLSGLGFAATGTKSAAAGLSADGSVILVNGDSAEAPSTPAGTFRWTAPKGFVRLESPSNAYLCSGAGISGDGVTVVGTCLQVNDEAFRWTASAAPVGLGRFGGGSDQTSSAAAISRDGTTTVGTGHPVLTGPVVWDAAGVATVIGNAGGIEGHGTAVSRDGTFVVAWSGLPQYAQSYRWTRAGGVEALGPAPEDISGTTATGISGDGKTVVGWGFGPRFTPYALIWDAVHGWRTLEAALAEDYQTGIADGWMLARANAISDDGHTIVGEGEGPDHQTQGWVLRLPN